MPMLSPKIHKKWLAHRVLSAVFFLFVTLQSTGCTTFNPATGRREFIFISTDSEVSMGHSLDAQIRHEFPTSDDKTKTDRLERIGHRVAQVSDRQDFQYHFYLVDKDELNAFTIPGGYIYFFTGLFDKLKTDDEIASVLAHEIGHSAARHTVKKYQAALGYDLVSRIVLGRIVNDTARAVTSLGGGVAANIAMSAYSRGDEYEADRLGIKYMRLAGYDLDAMIRTFEILKANSKGNQGPSFLSSHPYIDDRIKAIEKEKREVESKF